MTTVRVYTFARMQEIEDTTVVSGTISGDNLILTQRNGGTINAGNVRGPQGVQGPMGSVTPTELDNAIAAAHAAGSITTTQLANSGVTTAKIADRSITGIKIATNTILAENMTTGSVQGDILGNDVVTNGKLAANAVTDGKILNATISEAKLSDSLAAEQYAAGVNGWGGQISYYKVGNLVMVSYDRTSASLGSGTTVYTLPNGYRPRRTIRFPAYGQDSGGRKSLYVDIDTSGVITSFTGLYDLSFVAVFLVP